MFNLIFGKIQKEHESKYALQVSIARRKGVVISGWHLIALNTDCVYSPRKRNQCFGHISVISALVMP